MDASTPTGKLLQTLKQQLKAKHLNYRDVATQMKVSEATVKRYFSGKGVTVEVLQHMAAVVGLDLYSLVIVTEDQDEVHLGLSSMQLAALKRRGPLRMIFFMMLAGWSPAELAREFGLEEEVDAALEKLEHLGMIRRLAKRGAKILVRPSLGDRAYGEMSDLAIEAAKDFVQTADLRHPDCELQFEILRLSRASVLELRKIMQHFQHEIRELSRRDMELPAEETEWYRLFLAASRTPRRQLLTWKP